MHHRRSSGEKGVGRHQDVLPLDSKRPENDLERTGAAVDGNGEFHAAKRGELLLELGSIAAERQLAGGQHLLNPLGNPKAILGQELDLGCGNFVLWILHGSVLPVVMIASLRVFMSTDV